MATTIDRDCLAKDLFVAYMAAQYNSDPAEAAADAYTNADAFLAQVQAQQPPEPEAAKAVPSKRTK